jgi:hypothetical protein
MAKKSDKNLLNENTIRRMMKLAEIDSLSSDFITRNYVNEEEELEESVEEQSIEESTDETLEEGEVEVSSDISEEMEEEEMEMDAEMEDDAADAGDEVTISDEEAQDIIALADKLRAAVGEDEAEEPGEEMEMDAEMDMGSDEMEMSADMEEEPGKRYDDAMMEELKESIYKKVIERLLSEVKKEK